jgi:tetratricopeptide (TPR) repeat protein
MAQSPLKKLWAAIKPPPAVSGRKHGLNSRQKKMIWGTAAILFLIAAGIEAYLYVSSAPQRAQKKFAEGMQQMSPGKYQEAIQLFTTAIGIYPQMGAAYLERGNAQTALGRMDAALSDYAKAIENGDSAAAYTARGRVYLGRGDTKQAEEDFTRSLAIEQNSDAFYQRGQIHEASGDHRKAIEDYSEAILIQPDAPDLYRSRALAEQMIGDDDRAREDRSRARELMSQLSHR